jgi:hypothetical protein
METKLLSALGIVKAEIQKNNQYYQFVGEDENGVLHIIAFACPAYLTTSVDKAMQRLKPAPRVQEYIKIERNKNDEESTREANPTEG